eukprot:1143124-Pelagomonas_calceolata.AAC.7
MQRLRGNINPNSNRAGRTHSASSTAGEGKSQAKLIIIALFSVGVLGSAGACMLPSASNQNDDWIPALSCVQQPEGRLFPAAGHGDGAMMIGVAVACCTPWCIQESRTNH